jgi:hypothetical protein
LNELPESPGELFLWQATYPPQPQHQAGDAWDIQLMVFQEPGIRAAVPPKVRRSLQSDVE